MTEKKSSLVSPKTFYAVLLTAICMTFMQPFVVSGYHFPDLGFLAWIHLVPVVVAAHRLSFKAKLVLFWLAATLGLMGMLYWLNIALQGYGGLGFFSAFGSVLLLVLLLAFMMALPLALACWINRLNKMPLFLLLPAFMLTRDWIMLFLPYGGFPWMLPAYSQGQWLNFFQWIDHTGVLGLSFYIYLVNGLIADGLILFLYGKQLDKLVSRLIVVFVLSLASLFLSFLSARGFEKSVTNKGNILVALLQANISQDVKWDHYQAQANLDRYLKLTNQAVKNGAELVLWPETSYPYRLLEETLFEEPFLEQSEMAVPLFFGGVISRGSGRERRQFNGVFHVNTQAKIVAKAYKLHLVPFGEYLPHAKLLSHLGPIVQEVGAFESGKDLTLFEVKNFKFAPLICFEDLFPDIARRYAGLGADVLVNYTNDAWYDDSSAQHQHLVFSEFRALENRKPLIRVTNTGYTAVINASGEVIDEIQPFTETSLIHQLKVETAQSFYTRYGHFWAYFVIGAAVLIFIYTEAKWLMGPVRKMD